MNMHASLGLLMIFYVSVRGKMIQCFVDNTAMREAYCNELEKDSVLQKSYIDYFGLLLKDEHKIFEEGTSDIDTPIQITNKLHPKSKMWTLIGRSNSSVKVLRINESIVEYWDKIANLGTDLHIIKFHSKLVTMCKNGYQFSPQEIMVYLESSYNAVGIYYFTNNILIAQGVANDSVEFFSRVKKQLLNYNNNILRKEVEMWKKLTDLLKYEMFILNEKNNNSEKFQDTFNSILNDVKDIIVPGRKYPCSYVFMFRSKLLDMDQQHFGEDFWYKIAEQLNDGIIDICKDNKKLQMYVELISSVYSPKSEEIKGLNSINHLINALKIPVYTSEDRLLNYKATMLALRKISGCIGLNGWLFQTHNILCNKLEKARQCDIDLDYILTKLTHMQVYRLKNYNFVPDFIYYNGIDESIIHMIVTMAIDNIDSHSDLSLLNRMKMVEETIRQLNNYIKNLKKSVMEKDKRQLMVAYKWLAELHGVLCTDTRKQSEIQSHQVNLEKVLTEIIKLQDHKNLNDDHLKFLFYKKMCNDMSRSHSKRNHYKADGWILSNFQSKLSKFNFLNDGCEGVIKFLDIKNPFIHQADVNILIFQHLMMKTMDDSILIYIQNALSHLVVSSEDRVRNLQAHELYSTEFLWRHSKTMKNQGGKHNKPQA